MRIECFSDGKGHIMQNEPQPANRPNRRFLAWLSVLLALGCLALAGCQTGPSQREIEATVAASVRATQTAAEATAAADAATTTAIANLPTPTPEPPPFQPHELGPYLLESFYTVFQDTFLDAGLPDNFRLSDYKPQYAELIDRLENGENVFLEHNLFYSHIESWNHVGLILHEIMDREGFNVAYDNNIKDDGDNYEVLGDRLAEQNRIHSWVAFKKTAAEVLGKAELPLLQMFEDKMYEAAIKADNWSWYARE